MGMRWLRLLEILYFVSADLQFLLLPIGLPELLLPVLADQALPLAGIAKLAEVAVGAGTVVGA